MTTVLLSEVGRGEVTAGLTIPVVSLSPEEVGARIARAREEKKPRPWSQFDLALALSVSPSTIYRWEKGKLPSISELIRLADVLDKPLSYFAEPPEHQAELADLRQSDQEIQQTLGVIQDEADRAQEAIAEALASIDVRLSRIEELLGAQDPLGQTQP